MKASIIILNWNGSEADCIESVDSAFAQDYRNIEIIFVDNGSSNGSGVAIRALYPQLVYIQLDQNIGCPPGRNVGAMRAEGDLLFFLENDGAWDDQKLVSSAVELFKKEKKQANKIDIFV